MYGHGTSRRAGIIAVLFLALIASLLAACNKGEEKKEGTLTLDPKTDSFFIFDTIINIKVYDTRANEDIFNGIRQILKRIDSEVNRAVETSEIAEVNRRAGDGTFVRVSEETFRIVERAIQYARDSEGVFDPTVGPLVDLWGIGTDHAAVPSEEEIRSRLALVDYKKVELNEADFSIRLLEPGMSLDLGGIAKGYAADAIADYLRSEGFTSAIIDLGGNILAMGEKPGNQPWTIGLQNPDDARGTHFATIKLKNMTVVSSGVYERYFIQDGVRYHHIMDTSTGYPVRNELLCATVITEHSFDADGRSNTAFSLGLEKGLAFLEALENVEGVFVTSDLKVYTTSGLKGKLTITDSRFTLME